MEIEFRDVGGNRVGYIIGNDVKDNSGNRVGYIINGAEIMDNSGNRAGIFNGSEFRDNYGNRIGYLNGNEIRDNYGNRVGYSVSSASEIKMAAAAFLLFDLEPEAPQNASYSSGTGSEEKGGCLSMIAGFFMLFFKYFKGNAFSFKGTASRSEWWKKGLSSLLLMFVSWLVFGTIIMFATENINLMIIVLSILFVIIYIPVLATSVRRMHDMGKCGWWNLIPIIGFFLCGFFPGKTDGNPYI